MLPIIVTEQRVAGTFCTPYIKDIQDDVLLTNVELSSWISWLLLTNFRDFQNAIYLLRNEVQKGDKTKIQVNTYIKAKILFAIFGTRNIFK